MSDIQVAGAQDFGQVTFHRDGPLGIITLNRPEMMNAQGYEMLAQIDQGFDLARADPEIRVVIVRGSGGVFSAGHDLSPDRPQSEDPLQRYDEFKKYNLDLLLKWRDFPKPTIAMVDGYCIYAGWMLAAVMDLVFASDRAQFLGGFVEYNSIPWDLGFRKAKEICFESRFMTAEECRADGFVSRVFTPEDLERETCAFARRVAENDPFTLRMSKLQINKAQDAQGFRSLLEDSLGDYVAMMHMPGFSTILPGQKRLRSVDLAVRGRRGERHGQGGSTSASPPTHAS
jgi:enoyl-CoA hydratase